MLNLPLGEEEEKKSSSRSKSPSRRDYLRGLSGKGTAEIFTSRRLFYLGEGEKGRICCGNGWKGPAT